jgi:hypothetical protein
MTRRLPRFALAAAAWLIAAAPALAAGFVEGVEDLPLMDGLVSEPGSAVVFDKPDGRIVEAVASGPVSRAAAIAFYTQTLPQLGWTPAGPPDDLAFARDGERLELDLQEAGGKLSVRFAIAPK